MDENAAAPRSARALRPAGFAIGFALAGFFDGILLHQILQWHSLLSNLDGRIYEDLRFRMLTDGLFHAVMYLVGLAGLVLLFRARRSFAAEGSGRAVAAGLLVGFGAWHLLDAVLNHWILGLHHIREGDPNWLAYDLLFFALGLGTAGAGIVIGRRGPARRDGVRLTSAAAVLLATGLVGAGIAAATPLADRGVVTAVFRPGVAPGQVIAAMEAADARMIWSNPEGDVWSFAVASQADGWALYRHGALFVSGSYLGMGCFSATPPPTA